MIPEPIPLFVLTGFLGSGKTTLLQRMLRSPLAQGTGALINEFGEAALDHRIVAHVAETKLVVQAGCLCCSIRPELARGLLDLLRRSLAGEVEPFRRLVIETSGLSDPAPIIHTIQSHSVLREYFHVAGVITTVDSVNGTTSLAHHPEVAKQIGVADTVVLTKTDLAAPSKANELVARIRAINPVARVVDARSGGLDPASLLFDLRQSGVVHATSESVSEHRVRSFSLTNDAPVDWSAFAVWLSLLLHRHGERVLRLKAILNVGDEEPPVLVHGVQHIMHAPEHLPRWPDNDRRSHLVFIVKDIAREELEMSLNRFLAFAAGATGESANLRMNIHSGLRDFLLQVPSTALIPRHGSIKDGGFAG